jgi:hypothetical protein
MHIYVINIAVCVYVQNSTLKYLFYFVYFNFFTEYPLVSLKGKKLRWTLDISSLITKVAKERTSIWHNNELWKKKLFSFCLAFIYQQM